MGIRVHKVIGYGIKNLKTQRKTDKPNDPRLDYAAYREHEENEQGLPGLRAFVERIPDLIKQFGEEEHMGVWSEYLAKDLKRIEKDEPASYHKNGPWFYYEEEGGLKNVAVFTCPTKLDWVRYDDIIDYYEESTCRTGQPFHQALHRRVRMIQGYSGIYPYEGKMIRFRAPSDEVRASLASTSRFLLRGLSNPEDTTRLDGGAYNELVGRWDPKQKPLVQDEQVLKHLLNDWRPPIPPGILAVMSFMGCFPDMGIENPDNMRNSLRPIIYTYWS